MNRRQRRIGLPCLVLAGIAAAMAAWGCGDPGTPPVESSRTEATVKGVVRIHGKPAAGGTITFDPSNIRRKDALPRAVAIGKDGTYSVTTLIGENSVSVDSPETGRDPKLTQNMQTFVVEP